MSPSPSMGQMLLQAAITVFAGVLVYIVGKIIERAFLEPLNEQRRLITDIAASLVLYGNLYTNVETDITKLPDAARQALIDAQQTMRRQAAQLDAHNRTIPWYRCWSFLRLAPPRDKVLRAASDLIGISNGTPPRDLDQVNWNSEWREEASRLLSVGRVQQPSKQQSNAAEKPRMRFSGKRP